MFSFSPGLLLPSPLRSDSPFQIFSCVCLPLIVVAPSLVTVASRDLRSHHRIAAHCSVVLTLHCDLSLPITGNPSPKPWQRCLQERRLKSECLVLGFFSFQGFLFITYLLWAYGPNVCYFLWISLTYGPYFACLLPLFLAPTLSLPSSYLL